MARKAPKFPALDLSQSQQFRQAVQNIHSVYDATPEEVRRSGAEWFGRTHELVARQGRRMGLSTRQGAGVMSAVSPGMDWEKQNIEALQEVSRLRGRDWEMIRASYAHTEAAKRRNTAEQKAFREHIRAEQPGIDNATVNRMIKERGIGSEPIGRDPDVQRILKGMSISRATDDSLVKAHRIMEGEDFDVVLPRRSSPKTHSFATNIAEPDVAGPVTIDGRAHDIAANRMQGWEQGRGIGSADLKTGKKSRYEYFEDAYRGATAAINQEYGTSYLPHDIQAITWVGGKRIEMAQPTKSGKPRRVGPTRVGQPYVP